MKYFSQSHLLSGNLFMKLVLFSVFLLIFCMDVTESGFIIKTLPGFHDDLPFKLETGYIGVGDSDDVQLFYYFIESEGNPKSDPLMLWLIGGPGCSGLNAILNEIGPFTADYENSTLEKQIFKIKTHSWTKVANIIFIDQPAGTGYSYAKTPEAYITNDTLSTTHAYQFMRKWLEDHPKFLNNPFYVGGDSFGGTFVPIIVEEIYKGNEVGRGPQINIKGYVLGNPGTDVHEDYNSRIPYAHRMALLSDEIYESAKQHCHGEYINVDPNNTLCINNLKMVAKCLERIYMAQILEPSCIISNTTEYDLFRRGLISIDNTSLRIWPSSEVQNRQCRLQESNYMFTGTWANSKEVREALHIREEFDDIEWVLCNGSLKFFIDKKPKSYTHNIWSTVAYHQRLVDRNCRALIYSGDHDMTVPYLSTMNWIKSLNISIVNDWRPWFVEEQVAGYTMRYSHDAYNLTFATVKGGSHTAPKVKPKECSSMFTRWLSNDFL